MGLKFSVAIKLNTQAVVRSLSAATPQAVEAAADVFVQLEKEYVPVLTGNLRDHIEARPDERGPTYTSVIVAPAEDASNPWGFDPAYARRIEHGFTGTDSLGRFYNQPAQPYVRPAWEGGKEEALEAAKEVFAGVASAA